MNQRSVRILFFFFLVGSLLLVSCNPAATSIPQETVTQEVSTTEVIPTSKPTLEQASPEPTMVNVEPSPVPTEAVVEPTPGGQLTIILSGGTDSLDPNKSVFFFGRMIMRNIYDTLLVKDPDTGLFGPGLAESWEVSNDSKTLTFHLKSGVKFHDGTPFNADSMVFTFDRILDPATGSPYGGSKLGQVESYRAVDSQTFEVVLKEVFAPFFDALSEPALSPVSKAAVEKWGEDFGQHPVGTGPFMFKEWKTGEYITLVRNPDYSWGTEISGPAYLDQVTFRFITEAGTGVAMLETGDANAVFAPPASQVAELAADPQFQLVTTERQGFVRVVVLQTTHPPLDDVTVRRAIAFALNRDTYTEVLFENIGSPAYGPLSPNTFGYWSGVKDLVPNYDPMEAKELLSEAGWEDTDGDGIVDKDGVPLKLNYMTTSDTRGTATGELIQAMLHDVGIDVELLVLDQGAFVPAQQNGEADMNGMLFPSSDPDILFSVAHSSQAGPPGWNAAFYSNPELDGWLEKGRTTVDPVERANDYMEVQRIMVEELPYIPMYVQTDPWILTSNIHDFTFDPRSFPIISKVYMDQ
jgi:peptide/nickel transport system substrate-binding protein